MKQILLIVRRFIVPYKGKAILNMVFNLLAAILTLFSFATIIPILNMLFGLSDEALSYTTLNSGMSIDEWVTALKGNIYFLLAEQIELKGAGFVLMMLGVFLVVMTCLKCLAVFLASYSLIPIHTGVLRDIRQQLYDKIVGLPIGYFTEERKGDIMSRMTNDVSEVEHSIAVSLDLLFRDPMMILVYVITLFCISWQLTLFVLVLLPIAGWCIGKIGYSLKHTSNTGQEHNAEILTQIEETLGGLRVVKAFNAEKKLKERFNKLNNATRKIFVRINNRTALAHPISETLGTAIIALILWYGGSLILSDHSSIDAATFIYYLVIFYSIITPAKDLTRALFSIRKGLASLERIDKILDAQSTIKEIKEPKHIHSFDHEICYRKVDFAYQANRPVLKQIDLEIKKGQMIALVGQSGGGKTTIADLLPRFWDVTGGQITIDGIDIRELSLYDLRSLIGNVNQEAILFNDTFYNNITFGVDTTQPAPNGQSWQEAVERAAKIANAHDFIIATEKGYESSIGDRGSRLSGGQRQRLSIARAILKNPPILILDEATSALDTESEKLVQDSLEHLMRDRTTLVVAHRLSTIRNADVICVLHEGQIVEKGRHDELIALGGYYQKLVEMQNGDLLTGR